jgi:ABC-type nitrate/sulfonate/bicarbonate transport system permease component
MTVRKQPKKKLLVVIRWASLPAVIVLWFLLTTWGTIKPLLLPSPVEVARSLRDIGVLDYFHHVGSTVARTVVGFTSGALFGIGLGLVIAFNKYVDAALYNVIESWRPVPPVALLPFFVLWLGFSEFGKWLLVFFGCSLIMIVNTYEAVRNVRPIYKRAAYSLGASEVEVFRTIIPYAILPEIVSGLRIALATSVGLVIVSEFMGAQWGIGYLISLAKVNFGTPTIFLMILTVGIVSWFCDFILRLVMNSLTTWAERSSHALN